MESGEKSLRLLQYTAVETLPGGKRLTSENARSFYSNYFSAKGNNPRFWREQKSPKKYRFYATITILGDQRPYTLEFSVIKEERIAGSQPAKYREVARSPTAARALMIHFQKNLEKSLKDRNVIDDFRVF